MVNITRFYLFLVDPHDGELALDDPLGLPGNDDLVLHDAGWGDVDLGTSLLHQLFDRHVVGAADERVEHFQNRQPFERQLRLKTMLTARFGQNAQVKYLFFDRQS